MILMPIVYVTDMERSIEFYRLLGCEPKARSRSGSWTELHIGDSILGLHLTDSLPKSEPKRIELSFVFEESLEQLA